MAIAAKIAFMLSVGTVVGSAKFRFPCGPRDCAVMAKYDYPRMVNSLTTEARQATCESDDHGGWTVIQTRTVGTTLVNFERKWGEYVAGFGDGNNSWLGLDYIHRLTSTGIPQTLQVTMHLVAADDEPWIQLRYQDFSIGSKKEKYVLRLGQCSDPHMDSLNDSRDQPFRTPDHTNDPKKQLRAHCRLRNGGGWWYSACARSNLNLQGMFWGTYEVLRSTMRIRPTSYPTSLTRSPSDCQNGGRCELVNAKYACRCAPDYTGPLCKSRRTNLKKCANGGTPFGDDKCLCATSHAGLHCDFENKCNGAMCPAGKICSPPTGLCVCKVPAKGCHNTTAEPAEQKGRFSPGVIMLFGFVGVMVCVLGCLAMFSSAFNRVDDLDDDDSSDDADTP